MKAKKPNHRKLYAQFLKSDFWKQLSDQQKLLYPECAQCGSAQELQSHHWRYPSDWFETTLGDLKTLCRKCHRKEHGLYITPAWVEAKRRIGHAIMHEQRPAKDDWIFLKKDAENELMWDEFAYLVMIYALIVLNKSRAFCISVNNSILSRDARWGHLSRHGQTLKEAA